MATLTPKIQLKKPVPNVETDWAFRLNESLDILDDSMLAQNLFGTDGIEIFDDGAGNVTISGNLGEIITVSGYLQTQIDSVTLQEVYDNGDGTIITDLGKPFQVTGSGFIDGKLTVTGSLDMSATEITNVGFVDFNLLPTAASEEGRLIWDEDDGTLALGMPGGNVNLQIGQEGLVRATNKSGVDIPNGSVVHIDGAQGNRPTIAFADYTDANTLHVLGISTEDIDDNMSGFVTVWGQVRGEAAQPIDTDSFAEGDKLYLNVSGTYTNTPPTEATQAVIIFGNVIKSHATDGVILMTTPEIFTIGNEFDGTMRQSIINISTGTGAATGFTTVNDDGRRATFGIGGSNNTVFPDIAVMYNEGYNHTYQAVDGDKDFVWFTDPTDSHNNSSLNHEVMRITSPGNVGINTSSPTERLHVVGSGIIDGDLTVTGTTFTSLAAVDPVGKFTSNEITVDGGPSTSSLLVRAHEGAARDGTIGMYRASSGGSGPKLIFFRTAGTDDSPEAVTEGMSGAAIFSYLHDGSNLKFSSYISMDAANDATPQSVGGRIRFGVRPTASGGGLNDVMHITPDFNVGIGPGVGNIPTNSRLTVNGTISGTDMLLSDSIDVPVITSTSGTFSDSLTISGVPVPLAPTLQDAYDNGDGTITGDWGKPVQIKEDTLEIVTVTGAGDINIDGGFIFTPNGLNLYESGVRKWSVGRFITFLAIYNSTLGSPFLISQDAPSFQFVLAANGMGVGTSSPTEKLHVVGSGLFDGDLIATNATLSNSITTTSGIFDGGLRLPLYDTDPSPVNGDVWINTVTSGIRWQVDGVKFEVQGTIV